MVKLQAKQQKLELKSDIKPNDLEIFSDKKRIKQILLNLVSNSLKFTFKGHIQVTLSTHSEMSQLQRICSSESCSYVEQGE